MTKTTYVDGDILTQDDLNTIGFFTNMNFDHAIFSMKNVSASVGSYNASMPGRNHCTVVFGDTNIIDTANTNFTHVAGEGVNRYHDGNMVWHSWSVYLEDDTNATGEIRTKVLNQYPQTISKGVMHAAYQVANVLDNFEDASIGDWTTNGGVAETGGYLEIGSSNGSADAYYTGKNFMGTDDRVICVFQCVWQLSNTTNKQFKVYIHDGSSQSSGVAIISTSGNGRNFTGVVELQFDNANDEVQVFCNGVQMGVIDTSGLSTNLYVQFEQVLNQVDITSHVRLYALGDFDSTSFSTTVDGEMSVNAGTNFESITLGELHEFTNTGQNPVLKFTANVAANEMVVVYGLGFVHL